MSPPPDPSFNGAFAQRYPHPIGRGTDSRTFRRSSFALNRRKRRQGKALLVNDAQRILVVGLLLMVGATTAFVFLNFGQGAFSRKTPSLSLFYPVRAKILYLDPAMDFIRRREFRRSLGADSPGLPICRCRFCRAWCEEARLVVMLPRPGPCRLGGEFI